MTQEFVTLPREVVEQAIEAMIDAAMPAEVLRAALEQPQNHVPDAGNMVPAGWKLVPVEPTMSMQHAALIESRAHGPVSTGECNALPITYELGASAIVYRAMLDAAPQPPTVKHSLTVEQPQVEQEPVAKVVLTEQLGLPCLQWLDLDRQFDFKGGELLYTHPQPKPAHLTDEQIVPMFSKRQKQQTEGEKDAWYFYAWGVHDGEAANNIK